MMTSSDNELLVRIYEGQVQIIRRLDKVETEQQTQRTAIQGLAEDQRLIHTKLDTLQTSVYWVFAGIGIFIGALAIPAFLLAVMSFFKDKAPKPKTETADIETVARRVFREMLPELKS